MLNLRLDRAEPRLITHNSGAIKNGRSPVDSVYKLMMVISVFLVGMAAGNLFHPYQGKLAILAGATGLVIYFTRRFTIQIRQQKIKNKEAELRSTLDERLQKHIAHFHRPHVRTRKSRSRFISDRYRQLSYVPIAGVDEI